MDEPGQPRQPRPRLADVVANAVGPQPKHAMGYLNPVGENRFGSDGSGYIATMKLSTATVDVAELDEGTEDILSYDRCETADANIGQINMITASSFCGLNGALWGYHLAQAEDLRAAPLAHSADLFTAEELAGFSDEEQRRVKAGFPVYDASPLLEATERLFGRVDKRHRRHPPLPGAHVVCANKNSTVRGPAYAWGVLAIAIAKDPERDSNLFIKDCGKFTAYASAAHPGEVVPTADQVELLLTDHRNAVVKSIALCGQNYDSVEYAEVFVSAKAVYAGPTEVACALACAPYVLLAEETVPTRHGVQLPPEALLDLSLREWEDLVWPDQDLVVEPVGRDGVLVVGPAKLT
ncbi:histidine decarboxylase, pyruvoyl type [Actinokineospora iranica]|uniref:histidine decarboxylase n=1 Tax=Actinokineospora iranica TaxID=1271860 RepID=A0A1G6XFM1_9PSEU|nr:histidine decarboxylase, pyruvoyl type [Actinokineospora iranica]SDD76851.1 histidine decarboxylase [Actinokineospora iranica]